MATFDYYSLRAQKARLALTLNPLVRTRLWLACLTLVGVGLVLLGLGQFSGVIILSLVVLPLMPLLWYWLELAELPPVQPAHQLDDVLAGEVLGRLPKTVSVAQLLDIIYASAGGRFFADRFGLNQDMLRQAGLDAIELDDVWRQAWTIKSEENTPVIDAAMLLAALLELLPQHEAMLSPLHLGLPDIRLGLRWYLYVKAAASPTLLSLSTGGVGRDLSFGYTPLLDRFAESMSDLPVRGRRPHERVVAHHELVEQLVTLLGGRGRSSVVLIGSPGVGKTTVVQAFARYIMLPPKGKVPKSLEFCRVMRLNAAALSSYAAEGHSLESMMKLLFEEALRAKNTIMFLDTPEFFIDSNSKLSTAAGFLVQTITAGSSRLIVALDEQQWLQLSQRYPSLVQHMHRLNIQPPSRHATMHIMQRYAHDVERRHPVVFTYHALTEAYQLGERYVQGLAMPGSALSLLEVATQYTQNGVVAARSVYQAVENTFGVKAGTVDDVEERTMLLNLEKLIHERMINQTHAVHVVASALRRARTGVRNQDRPIGTFLFLGPTGVGKTELAKSLARIYFGGEDRLIRLDMNGYSQSSDVARLIADASDPRSLTAQIAKRPFSVVLLDEIEKAHSDVVNALLQMIDEGAMRDVHNRVISFKEAIVIATSNAGADRIRAYIEAGAQLKDMEGAFVDELIDAGLFKAEFINRFDEVVLFRPLGPAELVQVVDVMMQGVNEVLAHQKVTVRLSDDAKAAIVRAAYDPRLGARPMRRILQRTVEDIVSRRMLEGKVSAGSSIEITSQDISDVLAAKE